MRSQIWLLAALLVLEGILCWANWKGAQDLAQLQRTALQLHAQSQQAEGTGKGAQGDAAAAQARNEAARQLNEQGWSLIQNGEALQRGALTWQAWSLLVLAAILGIGLRSYVTGEREVTRRRQAEAELRAEHASLESRIEQRTAELRAEVDVRTRAEERNRRQKRVLEMLANRAPLEEIFAELTASVAVQRRSWESAIHLVDAKNSSLQLVGSSRVSDHLEHYLRSIATGFPDAPESRAWATGEPCFIGSMNQEHRPWSEFLFSNGIRSAWSLPLLHGDGIALGTLTIYSRLLGIPGEEDREVLDSAVRLASLVLDVQNMNRELHRKAYQDELTGVANRRAGEMRLRDAIARSRRQNESFAVMCIDVDRFKRINDIYGHACGDRVLLEVSKRISAHPVVKGAMARMGGDEFLVLLESCPTDELACKTAGELVTSILQPMELGCEIATIGASVGIAMFPRDGDTPDELERHADAAMYQAKRRGIGWCAFSSAMRAEVTRATSIEEALREALDPEAGQGMLAVHYQPIYKANGAMTAMEALLRFHHPKLGDISPAQFIPIAEETSLILPLGHWVLQQVCSQIVLWQEKGIPPLRIGVNISGIQWGREDFVEEVEAILNESHAPAHALTLELTESVMMQNASLAKQHMRKLKDLGVRFAMDDFGTGYSSFSYLHQLPLDILKIDRSFIARLGQSDDSRAIVASIVSMAHMLGLITIAEGVETEAQRLLLTEMECDGMQGFLFAKPMPASDATALRLSC